MNDMNYNLMTQADAMAESFFTYEGTRCFGVRRRYIRRHGVSHASAKRRMCPV